MTKEQKKRADEIAYRIDIVSQQLKELSDMTRKARTIYIGCNLDGIVQVSDRVKNIIFTIVEADYKDELAKLEAEFEAL